MKEMTSGIRSTPYRLTRQITQLLKAQDDATARMGSDKVGVFGTADPDFIGFLTGPFKTMKPVTVQSGAGLYSTIAILPEQQHATIEDRYYNQGQPFVMDRAGTAVTGLNILRNGPPPAGYYGGDKLMVQRRFKRYFRSEDSGNDFNYVYDVEVRREEKGYVLQEDERLDGGFFPGSIYLGVNRPYGWTFPVGDNGNLLYSPDPFTDAGWSGSTITPPVSGATKPVIDSISPASYTLGEGIGVSTLTITGSNFTDCGFVLVGPFQPVGSFGIQRGPVDIPTGDFNETLKIVEQPDGAYYYRLINEDGTEVSVSIPGPDWVAGTYNIIVIGNDGQFGIAPNAFTVIDPDA